MLSEEIAQQRVSLLGQYRFRMELNALDGELTMANTHDLAVLAFGGDIQARGQRRSLDRERMISRRGQRVGQPGKRACTAVRDRGELAVHHALRTHDAPTERLADRLVPEADAEDRDLACEALHQRHRNARLRRRAWAGRDDNALRCPGSDLLERHGVVAMDVDVLAELAEILDEVVGEAVVV